MITFSIKMFGGIELLVDFGKEDHKVYRIEKNGDLTEITLELNVIWQMIGSFDVENESFQQI